MKVRLIILAIFVVILNTSSIIAEEQSKESKALYNYWAKRGIIEMTFAFMQDYQDAVGDKKLNKKEIDGINLFPKTFINDIDDKGEIDTKYNEVSDFLKKYNWSKSESFLFGPLNSNLKTNIPLNDSFFDTSKPDGSAKSIDIPGRDNKMVHWVEVKKRIISDYNTDLNILKAQKKQGSSDLTWSGQNNKNVRTSNNPDQSPPSSIAYMEPNWICLHKFISIIFLILLLIIEGYIVFFYTKYRYSKGQNKTKKKRNNKQLKNNNLSGLTMKFRIQLRKISRYLIKHIRAYYRKGKEFLKIKVTHKDGVKKTNDNGKRKEPKKEEDEISKNAIAENSNQEITDQQSNEGVIIVDSIEDPNSNLTSTDIENRTNQLFYDISEEDGSFIVENGKPTNDGRKIFVIEISENGYEGKLRYITSELDKRVITRLDSILKPVCDIENITIARNAFRIEMISPGEVNLRDNNKWVVTSKLKIKFI